MDHRRESDLCTVRLVRNSGVGTALLVSLACAACAGDLKVQDAAIPGDDLGEMSAAVCVAEFEALDAQCETDRDCAVVVQERCSFGGRDSGAAVGINRAALDAFDALAEVCSPRVFGCDNEALIPGPIVTDDGVAQGAGMSAAVRCEARQCVTFQSSCGAAQCGNGTVDHCVVTESLHGSSFGLSDGDDHDVRVEPCDGTDLSGQSCASLGFAGGRLACDATACLLDTAECTLCAAPNEHLRACASGLWGTTREIAVASSEEEIAVVTTPLEGAMLRFGRWSHDLSPLSDAVVATWLTDLAIARHADGWVVVGVGSSASADEWSEGVAVHAFDRYGQHLGLAQTILGATDPTLTVGTGRAPLLTYALDGARHATLLSSDLKSHTAPVELERDAWGNALAPVFVGDGFLVPVQHDDRVVLRRVELDGALDPARADLPSGTLVVNDLGVRFVTADSILEIDPRMLACDGEGVPIREPIVGGAPVGLGDEILVPVAVMREAGDAYRHEVVALNSHGKIARRTVIIAVPGQPSEIALSAAGSTAVVAWHDIGSSWSSLPMLAAPAQGIGLAHLSP